MSLLNDSVPFQLIFKENGQFQINQRSLEMIKQIKNNLAICVIVGPYRQGKSFLLNKLLGESVNEFRVAHYDEPCTEGIWVNEHPARIKDSLGNKITILMLDVEVI